MVARHECSLEQDMPQVTPSTTACAFAAQCATVMCNRCKSAQSCCLFAADLTEFRHFGNKHSAGDRTNPGNGAKYLDRFGQGEIGRDGLLNPTFQLRDLAIQKVSEVAVHIAELVLCAKFLMRFDLCQKSLARFNKLASLGGQGSEKT